MHITPNFVLFISKQELSSAQQLSSAAFPSSCAIDCIFNKLLMFLLQTDLIYIFAASNGLIIFVLLCGHNDNCPQFTH